MSTQHGGGRRRPPSVKPGGKPTTDTTPDEAATAVDDDEGEASPAAVAEETTPPTKSARTRSADATKTATTRTGAAGAAKTGSTRAGTRPVTKSTGKAGSSTGKAGPRRPIAPIKVSQGRNWGPIALFAAVALLALGIIGYASWAVYQNSRTFEQRAADIEGVTNYLKQNPSLKQPAQHAWGPQTYPQSPPVGGKHNPNWQNCMGDVYDAQIANEHAVHAMEHGAVWLTYNPDKLSKDQVEVLAKKVRGQEYLLMSPYPSLDKAISVQAWGFQLKVDKPDDKRIDQFIKLMRKSAGIETAQCSGGITETGTTPRDLGKDQPQQPQQPGG
jgi:hypothetical protein